MILISSEDNLVQNPFLEIPSSDPSIPDKWDKGFDDVGNTVTFRAGYKFWNANGLVA